MKYEVRLTELAHAEADFAFKWIEQSSPTSAIEWFNGLVDAVGSLSSMPERCVVAPESEEVGQEVRQLFYGKYRILFSIEKQTVFILHVRHGRQKYLAKENF